MRCLQSMNSNMNLQTNDRNEFVEICASVSNSYEKFLQKDSCKKFLQKNSYRKILVKNSYKNFFSQFRQHERFPNIFLGTFKLEFLQMHENRERYLGCVENYEKNVLSQEIELILTERRFDFDCNRVFFLIHKLQFITLYYSLLKFITVYYSSLQFIAIFSFLQLEIGAQQITFVV